MDFTDKANAVADKMNQLTEKFKSNLDIADDMQLTGLDLIESIEERTNDVEISESDDPEVSELVNLRNLMVDFKYLRDTLKENTDNGRKILNNLCIDLLQSSDDLDGKHTMADAEMIASFAELNKALADNMKLYIQSYKEISNIIMNLEKIKSGVLTKTPTNNTLNITNVDTDSGTVMSTAELIKSLSKQ